MDGTVSVEEIDKSEEDAKLVSDYKKWDEEERKREILLRGWPGKGHKGNYVKFCRGCFREYDIDIPNCTHCRSETVTKVERMIELKEKLDKYKSAEVKRKEKKDKWDLWVKTQAMFYKKTSTNYKKWDYFEPSSDSEKEEQEPILPTDNPEFKAMEQDLSDRRKTRIRDTKEANKFKEDGNAAMKWGHYKTANKCYSDALELRKDILPLYSNWALAWNKLGDF